MRPQKFSRASVRRVSRRAFIRESSAALPALSLPAFSLSPGLLLGCKAMPQQKSSNSPAAKEAGVLDQALEVLRPTGPEYRGGLANHGPMAVEALITMGRAEAVMPWLERYKRILQNHPVSRNPISHENWREALGDFSRVGDWIVFFDREMKEQAWPVALSKWVENLAPGLVAAAAHGLIRTAHASRSLANRETELRRHELAEGLGYWAARYQALPTSPENVKGSLKPSQAISRVKLLPPEQRAASGLIADRLSRLDNFPPFASVSNLVDSSGDASRFISDLTETFARVYMTNAQNFGSIIAFVHAMTGPSAIRLLVPYLRPEATKTLLRFGWQAAAAFYATFGRATPSAGPFENTAQNKDDLIDRSIAAGEEHAIKFTEVCLREYEVNPSPVYLLAARHAADNLRQS